MIEIREATEVSPDLVDAFARLLPQLSRSAPPPSAGELGEVVASAATVLLVAVDTDLAAAEAIVGTLTVVLFRIPTGLRAWIEDVVVDFSGRGRGVGEALNRRALEIAEERGVRTVDLTSRPDREQANRLYRRLGFAPRETNIYRYEGGR